MVVCADLNSLPGSEAYRLLTRTRHARGLLLHCLSAIENLVLLLLFSRILGFMSMRACGFHKGVSASCSGTSEHLLHCRKRIRSSEPPLHSRLSYASCHYAMPAAASKTATRRQLRDASFGQPDGEYVQGSFSTLKPDVYWFAAPKDCDRVQAGCRHLCSGKVCPHASTHAEFS